MPKKANAKKIGSKNQDFRKIGLVLFWAGFLAVLISLAINLVFIKPTDFKAQHRQRQDEQCLAQKTDPDICQRNFGSGN